MVNRAKSLWLNLWQSLGFLPGLIVLAFAVLGIVLVQIDEHLDLNGVQFVFKGDGSAARTVLSVIAGSLITVAGLTFSITMVVLQLASSQFSPRILRTFFADRVTQVTIGTFVGTFVYSILTLRAVGSFGTAGFVPRLSVTLASLFGIGAVVLLVVFLQHVSQLVQVSHVTATIAHQTLARMEIVYPQRFGEPAEAEDAGALLAAWRAQPPGRVLPERPGYVQRIGLDDLADSLDDEGERVAILVCPGDFVSVEMPIAQIWPAEAAERYQGALRAAVSVSSERDLSQDVAFGLRQLTDVALKAISPSVNDPMTAVTCISYLRSLLVRLAERADPPAVRRFAERDLTFVVRQREFAEQLDAMRQLSRYVNGDGWVAGALLDALHACAEAALGCGAYERARAALGVATTVAEQNGAQATTAHDRERIAALSVRTQDLLAAAGGET